MSRPLLALPCVCLALGCAASSSGPKTGVEKARDQPESASAPIGPSPGGSAGTVSLSATVPGRVLRGDWEAPATLLLTYEPTWRQSLAQVIAAASKEVDVYVIASRRELGDWHFTTWLDRLGAQAVEFDHETAWVRDYGPLEIFDEVGRLRWLDLTYYGERPRDDTFPQVLSRLAGVDVETYELPGEGGGLASNGAGLCAVTEPSYDRLLDFQADADRAQALHELLGCQSLAIVPALSGEETGHVDVLVQFLSRSTVAVGEIDADLFPDQARELDTAARALVDAAAAISLDLGVVRVPMTISGNEYFTYVNGTRLRGRYLVPSYQGVDSNLQQLAYQRLRKAMPQVELAPINADPMVERGGAIHCLTLGLDAHFGPAG